MFVGQSEPSFVTCTVSPSPTGVVNSSKKEFAIRSSRLFLGADNTRRLNPVPLISCGDVISANISIVPLMGEEEQAGLLIIVEDISEAKRVQGAMRRFMTQKVVDQVMGRGDELLFGAACPASVLFADIRSFTTLSEKLPAREVVEMLNEIFTELFEAVAASDGVLDKFMGDGLMAVYGAPLASGRDPLNAVDSALQMTRSIAALNVGRAERGLPPLRPLLPLPAWANRSLAAQAKARRSASETRSMRAFRRSGSRRWDRPERRSRSGSSTRRTETPSGGRTRRRRRRTRTSTVRGR